MNNFNYVSNVDTICVLLDIENYEENSKEILDMLETEKEKAKQMITITPTYKHFVNIGDTKFELLTSGSKGYSFILQNSAYKIYIAKYKSNLQSFAPIQIRISSEYLWAYGLSISWSYIYNVIVENFGNICREKVCRLDLCTHVSGIDFVSNYESSYKGSFKKSQIFRTNNSISAITFGSRQNKNIYCRIYNKSLEIQEKKHKVWFYDIWKNNNIDSEKVWNIEFEIKSKLFKRFNIVTVNDVMIHIRDLWEFCTKEWLVKINRTNERVERCKTSEEWLKIQNAFQYLSCAGLIEREKQISTEVNILIPNIASFLTSYSARKNINDIDKTLQEVKNDILKYLSKKETTFELESLIKSLRLRDCEVKQHE